MQDCGSQIPARHNGQCPLLEKNRVVIAPVGKKALMVALDKATGREIWTTPNPDGFLLSHAQAHQRVALHSGRGCQEASAVLPPSVVSRLSGLGGNPPQLREQLVSAAQR